MPARGSDAWAQTTNTPASATANGVPVPPDPRALTTEGRRLMRSGHFREAAEKLKQAAAATPMGHAIDSELWFDLGHCLERLGRDDEAIDSYRKYKTLPMTLRVNEAEERIQAIHKRKHPVPPTAAPKTPIRHVLVPTASDQGRCASQCLESSTCWKFPGDSTNAQFHCAGAQFSCLRSCSGARVQAGTCPKSRPGEQVRCIQDRVPLFGPGWLAPQRF